MPYKQQFICAIAVGLSTNKVFIVLTAVRCLKTTTFLVFNWNMGSYVAARWLLHATR